MASKRNEARSISSSETPGHAPRRRATRPKTEIATQTASPVTTIGEPADTSREAVAEALKTTAPEFSTEQPASVAFDGADRDAIAQLAYSYWEARGGVGGSAEEDWLRAEEEYRRKRSQR